jgi:hypothetical protein
MAHAPSRDMRVLAATLLVGCATTSPPPKGGPRGLHANEHLETARRHDELARREATWPESPHPDAHGGTVPWFRTWDTGVEHERLATLHRSRAAQLQAAYQEACGERPLDEVAVSPLVRFGTGGWNTSTGVILYLAPEAGPAERLLADLRCHRAWMMLAPAGMDDCPLDLPGLVLDARGDGAGITVSIAVSDRRLVGELQRRAARDLESSAQLRRGPAR